MSSCPTGSVIVSPVSCRSTYWLTWRGGRAADREAGAAKTNPNNNRETREQAGLTERSFNHGCAKPLDQNPTIRVTSGKRQTFSRVRKTR